MRHYKLAVALTTHLAISPAVQASLYSKTSPVLQVSARSYDSLIAKSNHTSIVEFYAPWCGHCRNLKSTYEKVASNLDGLAKVAAIDCDENQKICSDMGVQGFPILKIVRPSKKPGGKPLVEDYSGMRSAKAITDAVVDKINNHVTRLTEKSLNNFLAGEKPKVVLFTEKTSLSALLRSIAIDYLDVMPVGQIQSHVKAAAENFSIEKFPTLVLFPGKDQATSESEDTGKPIIFNGKLTKKDVAQFLLPYAQPNPDPAPTQSKNKKKHTSTRALKKSVSSSVDPEKATRADADQTSSSSASTAQAEKVEKHSGSTAIASIATPGDLIEKCLQTKSVSCVLALIPSEATADGDKTISSLSQLNHKYLHGKRHLFPFYSVPSDVEGPSSLRDKLRLGSGAELVIINARRGWWRRYDGDFSVESIETWIDAIRMGEGKKSEIPEGVIVERVQVTAESIAAESSETSGSAESRSTADPVAEEETVTHQNQESQERIKHEEL